MLTSTFCMDKANWLTYSLRCYSSDGAIDAAGEPVLEQPMDDSSDDHRPTKIKVSHRHPAYA